MNLRMWRRVVSPVVLLGALGALPGAYAVDRPPLSPAETQAVAVFEANIKDYVALHEKLEATVPAVPKRATPEQVDKFQRTLGDLIKGARRDAKPGAFFAPEIQAMIKRFLSEALSGPDGKTMKASIMDENPGLPKITINERYPSSIPLSTMPPPVLAALPKLHGELEYRFIGPRLVLVDTEVDLILDFTAEILPN